MKRTDQIYEAFQTLNMDGLPTQQQKEKLLQQILLNHTGQQTIFSKAGKLITVYPWRFAFAVSSGQAILLTLIFGTKYTELMLKLFVG